MSISPRITQRLMTEQSLTSMQTSLGRVAKSQEQLTTGRVINRPSDSPTGTNQAMRLREQVSMNSQFKRNSDDGLARLGRIDSVLTSSLDQVRRARELTLQGANTGSMGPQARDALATEVRQIREALIGQANTTHLDRPLFGGTTTNSTAYLRNPDGTVTYQGDTTEVNRRIGDQDTVRVDVHGTEAFGVGADDVFALLDKVANDLQAGDSAAIAEDLDKLDIAMKRLTGAIVDVGARYTRVESSLRVTTDTGLDLQTELSQIENVDMARAMVDLQMNEVAYQASLGATARVLQPSLLDFLR
jgi:flagellar hook-associated protein 3 FlgL